MINSFLIISCTGKNNSIGLKSDNKFFKVKLQNNINSNNLLVSNIISLIKKHKVKDNIDIDFFYSSIPIIHKESKYKIHDLTFMEEWRPRVYNFGQFRKYMKIHCPIPSLINTFIYDIVFLIYIRQFFNRSDFKLLMRCIRKEDISPGFQLIISSISGIK